MSELELSKSSAEKVKKVESTAASHDKQTEGSQSQKESSQDRKQLSSQRIILFPPAAGIHIKILFRINIGIKIGFFNAVFRWHCRKRKQRSWKKNNPLGAEFSRFGTFDQLRENARNQLKELILNLSDNPQSKIKGTNAQKVSDLYALGMDSARLNREGAAPLMPMLDKI
mgnify:CR=1 FL=1